MKAAIIEDYKMEVKEFCEKYAVSDRHNTNSFKWDRLKAKFGNENLLPMWVADMDFKVPECVVDAVKKRAEHGIFGYAFTPDSYYEAVIDWNYKHYGQMLNKEHIRVAHGVVSTLYWLVDMFTKPQDAVIILTPVYNHFADAANVNGRRLVSCELNYDKGIFTFDGDRFERLIKEFKVKMFILCSPHNPAGRVWSEKELDEMLYICDKHDVIVVSDEIHRDITFDGHKHIPSSMVSNGRYRDRIITCNASSKTFNLATCLTSNVIIDNDSFREIYDKFCSRYFYVEDNVFGLAAVEAALRGGEEWYEAMKKTVYSNYLRFKNALSKWDNIYVSPLEGTYLMFVDFKNVIGKDNIRTFIQDKCHIAANYGEAYGENFKGFVRFNLAAGTDTIDQAINLITSALPNT